MTLPARPIRAEDQEQPIKKAAVGLEVALSLVNNIALTLSQTLSTQYRIQESLAVGFASVQVSVMPKLVLGGEHHHFVSGLGLAVAPISLDTHYEDGVPVWLLADVLGYEYLSSHGWGFSLALGLTGGLGGGRLCFPDCDGGRFKESVTNFWFPEIRLGVASWR